MDALVRCGVAIATAPSLQRLRLPLRQARAASGRRPPPDSATIVAQVAPVPGWLAALPWFQLPAPLRASNQAVMGPLRTAMEGLQAAAAVGDDAASLGDALAALGPVGSLFNSQVGPAGCAPVRPHGAITAAVCGVGCIGAE